MAKHPSPGRAAGALIAVGLSLSVGCGQFGLPTGRDDGEIQREDPTLLDVDPKVASQGTFNLEVSVLGIDTFFDATTVVELPLLGDVDIVDVQVLSVERLILILDIPSDSALGTSPLEVTSDRDGTLIFEDGFTVVP